MLGRAGRELVSLRLGLGLSRGLSRGLARWATRTVIVPLPQLLVLQQRQEQEAGGRAGQTGMGLALAIACNVVLSDVVYFCSKLRHQEYAQVHFSTIKT